MGCPPSLPAKAYARGPLAVVQHHDCTNQPAAAQPAQPSEQAAALLLNAGANPQSQPAGSQDNCKGKLLLPQLNHLHEAFKLSQVSHPVSSNSQDQRLSPRYFF